MVTTWSAAGNTEGSGSAVGRIALVVIAVLAIMAYAILQLKARSRRVAGTRRYDPWDWRTYPEDGGPADQALSGPEEGRRPEWRYGYPPGYEPYPLYESAELPWTDRAKTEPARDQAS
jgi:hypothetical protein